MILGDKMNNASIKNISIKLNSKNNIIVTPNMFNNLYISNLNKNGEEIAFIQDNNSNKLTANFFMVKLSDEIIEYNLTQNNLKENAFKLLKNEIINEVDINFKNGYTQPFLFKINKEAFILKTNNDLCILVSEQDIKFKENLFI